VPLPPGLSVDSAELFGLFTYEMRVGHADIWSTAQGRFGRPLRSNGVQHPAPTLFCTIQRTVDQLIVEAPFARAVLHGKNITADPPRTQLWALLYAQVRQADGADWRNILLDDRRLRPRRPLRPQSSDAYVVVSGASSGAFQNRDAPARGEMFWTQDEIEQLLLGLGLPIDSPLSVLCVEMMPTLAALQTRPSDRDSTNEPASFASAVINERSGGSSSTATDYYVESSPLSDELGHHRILRTSPLVAAPAVC
jgi:hypothetical protein